MPISTAANSEITMNANIVSKLVRHSAPTRDNS
jgi:hypothetical protein